MKPTHLSPAWASLRHSLGLALMLAIPHAAEAALTPEQEEIVRQCRRGEEGARRLWELRGRAGVSSGAGAAPGRPHGTSFLEDLRAVSEEKDLDPQVKRYISFLASSREYLSHGVVESWHDAPAGAGAPEQRTALPAPVILEVVPCYVKPEGLVLQLVASNVGTDPKAISVHYGETPDGWDGEFDDVNLWADAADPIVSFAAPQLETGRFYLRLDVGGRVSDPVEFSFTHDGEEREGKDEAGPDTRKRKPQLRTEGDEGSDVDAAPARGKKAKTARVARAEGGGGGGASAAAVSASATGEEEAKDGRARDERRDRTTYSKKQRQAAIKMYKERLKANPKTTIDDVAHKLKIPRSTLSIWLQKAIPKRRQVRTFSKEQRAAAVKEAIRLKGTGETWVEIGRQLKLRYEVISRWVREHEEGRAPTRRTWSMEEQALAVQRVLADESIPVAEVARKYRYPLSSLHRWVGKVRPRGTHRSWSDEEKKALVATAIKRIGEGEKTAKVFKDLNISEDSFYCWKRALASK